MTVLSCVQIPFFGTPMQDIPKGEIIGKVACKSNPEQSYALFLPSNYTSDQKWPVLYAFDPHARGQVPLEHFRKAAETHGYIVVGSNNSKNGPWAPVIKAANAMWTDTNLRFSVDRKRIYTVGFSGGSRAAAAFSKFVGHPVTGIIGIGAGIPHEMKPEQVKPSYYLGIAGLGDFNYQEMMRLDREFDSQDVSHRMLFYEEEHVWPPQEICSRAIEWMEIMAMKQKLKPLDSRLIDTIFSKELEEAQSVEDKGQIFRAVSEYEVIVSAFEDWKDTQSVRNTASLLQRSKEYEKSVKEENERKNREESHRNTFMSVFARLKKSPETFRNLHEIFSELGIYPLVDKAENQKDFEEHFLAVRLLLDLTVHADETGTTHSENKDYSQAILYYEIAAKASEYRPSRLRYISFELACIYALNNQKKKALKKLELAVENGFDRVDLLEKEDDLKSIRDTKEFQKILKDLKDKEQNRGLTLSE